MTKLVNFNDSNISITMRYDDLIAIMNECVKNTIKSIETAEKNKEKQKWLSTQETARVFGKSKSTIQRWKQSGYLTARTMGGRDYFSVEEVNSLSLSKAS